MARRKKVVEATEATEEVEAAETVETAEEIMTKVAKDATKEIEEQKKYDDILNVTDEFVLEDVSDTAGVPSGEDLDVTEVESLIEKGAKLEPLEETPLKIKRNRTTVDSKVNADAILAAQKEKEELEEAAEEKQKKIDRQKMARVKPVISQIKKNNGIRTSTGLFFR